MITDLIRIAAAVIPAFYLLYKIYQADRVEREPVRLLLSLILLGILATALATSVEIVGGFLLDTIFLMDTVFYRFLFYFFVVALSEEGFKYLLLKWKTWDSPEFNCRFDGIVYAVFVSLGFALWENIGYVVLYGLHVAVLRAVTAIPGHACFGVFMGAWYGLAKKFDCAGNRRKTSRYCKLALVSSVLLHGSYDFIATMEAAWCTGLFVIFMIILFWVTWRVVKQQSRQDHFFVEWSSSLLCGRIK